MLPVVAPQGKAAIETFLLEDLPAMGPPPRGAEGLARARRFFTRAGDPQDGARPIHVVGTAGKGTATAAIVARLVGAGASVGAHLSPHVYDLRERFLLDGALPTWPQVDAALRALWPALTATESAEGRPPSFFELTAALSWTIGRLAGVRYHVTEAGIGGRFDATNAISRPDKVTVVMPIGYDHLEILGHDLEAIAIDKAAVIGAQSQVVLAPQDHPVARETVMDVAARRGATVHEVLGGPIGWEAQARAVADLVMDVAAIDDPGLDLDASPAPVHLPGRMERVPAAGRVVVLDGAHNPLKLRAVQTALGQPAAVLVAALSREKDLDACAAELAKLAHVVIASDFAVSAGERVVRRSWSAAELAAAIKRQNPDANVREVPGIAQAIDAALATTPDGATILATGSFMMLDPARQAAEAAG